MSEDQRRGQEERFDVLSLGIYEADNAGALTFVSPRWCEITGISSERALAGVWLEAIHPKDRPNVLAMMEDRTSGKVAPGQLSIPFRFVHEGGVEVWVQSASMRMLDEADEVSGFAGFLLDVTASRRKEQAQRASEERYRTIVETAAEGIWVIDAAGRTTFTNQRMAEMLGWTSEEMLGRPLDDFMDEEGKAITAAHLERRKHGVAEAHDFKFTHRSGAAVWTMLSTTPFHDEEGAYVGALAMATDVSQRRQAEAKIRELNADLERRNQQLELANRELESFSYSVSHDLRAPLRAIDGFSLALLSGLGDAVDATAKGYLARVRRATETMGQLIDDLLLLSRVTRSEIREARVDLGAMAEEITARLRAAHPEREVEVVIDKALTAWGDGPLLRTLLDNLLDNAWKYTSKKARARVEVGARVEGGERIYFVRDDGAGFDMRYAGKLFNAFQRLHTEREFPGTGIGLATAARIVGRHGGRLWGVGAPGEGATFSFVLGGEREGDRRAALP